MEPGGVLAVPAGRRYPAGAGGAILSAARPAATDRTHAHANAAVRADRVADPRESPTIPAPGYCSAT